MNCAGRLRKATGCCRTPGFAAEELVKQAETVGLKSYPGDDPDILVKNFDIKPIATADEDLRDILG